MLVETWKKSLHPGTILLTCCTLFIGCFMVLPLVWMVSSSLKLPGEVFEYPIRWIPRTFNWSNYPRVLFNSTLPMARFFINSAKVALLNVFGVLIVSSLAAYAFARLEFRFKNIIFLIYLATLMIPNQVLIIPKFLLFRTLGMFNTHLALILPNICNVMGIFMLRQFFMGIPRDYSDAALIDGANHFQIWIRIIMPLSRSAVITLCVLSFIASWNDYLNALIFITSKSLYTIPIALHFLVDIDSGFPEYNLQMAAACCAVLPILLVFFASQKMVIEGIGAGGLKG